MGSFEITELNPSNDYLPIYLQALHELIESHGELLRELSLQRGENEKIREAFGKEAERVNQLQAELNTLINSRKLSTSINPVDPTLEVRHIFNKLWTICSKAEGYDEQAWKKAQADLIKANLLNVLLSTLYSPEYLLEEENDHDKQGG